MSQSALTDTICAISTAPGVGGIAIARISGPRALSVADAVCPGLNALEAEPRKALLQRIIDTRGEILDRGLVTIFRSPASYTGDDLVEIAVHGSLWIQQELIATLCHAGARLAHPGEFTQRAFASGRIDLAEAEGVADIIAARSRAGHRLAISQMRGDLSRRLGNLRQKLLELASLLELELDFAEEDVEFASRPHLRQIAADTLAEVDRLRHSFASGSAIRHGIPVAIIGATNVGKSSLLNALAQDDRAIVSDIHGTTRDIVEDTITIGDYTFRILDTAGLRHTTDTVERLGIERTLKAADSALITIILHDATRPQIDDNIRQAITRSLGQDHRHLLLVVNKTDAAAPAAAVSALKNAAIASSQSLADSTATTRSATHNPETERASTHSPETTPIALSAKTGEGIDTLRNALTQIAAATASQSDILITSARHREALDNAAISLTTVVQALDTRLSADFIAQDLRQALNHLGEITGAITPADLLSTIFSRFCIGK